MGPRARRIHTLAGLPGVGPTTIRRIAAQLGGWEALAAATTEQLLLLTVAVAGKRAQATPDAWIRAEQAAELRAAALEAGGAAITVPGDPTWPTQIERLGRDAPLWLYVRGDMAVLQRVGVAVIGSREPTPFGLRCAERFGQRIAEADLSVISGLALGCDAAAHRGCITGRGRGVAVLPGPVDRIVPSSHRDLAERLLADGGCLVSEYPPDPSADIPAHQFVARDRIQAGLAAGVLLTESSLTGGSMHAVHAAQRAGIPVACLMSAEAGWQTASSTAANRQLITPTADRPAATALVQAGDLQQWLGVVRASATASSAARAS